MVVGDVDGERMDGIELGLEADPKGDGGVVVLLKDLVMVVVLKKVKKMVICMVEFGVVVK